jgi:citrate synthase
MLIVAAQCVKLNHAWDPARGTAEERLKMNEHKPANGAAEAPAATASPDQAVGVTDLRTGSAYRLPIADDAIRALDLRRIRTSEDGPGLLSFDPGLVNTVTCHSAITFIDGDRGILRYRGYPIEQLAERSSFLEVAYLLLEGELPSAAELDGWRGRLAEESRVPDELLRSVAAYPTGIHPMSLLTSLVAALGAFHAEARDLRDPLRNRLQARRLIAQVPILAAAAYRASQGEEAVQPDPSLGYVGSLLAMLFGDHPDWKPDPTLGRALDLLFVLQADHEQNCSTSAVRGVASAGADPYSAIAAGTAALSGPLHGGANEAVLLMLREIGSIDHVPAFIAEVKAGRRKLMGFGHRVYKSYDPRAKIIQATAKSVFEVTGVNPLLEIALELEGIALADPYFIQRRLYPNVDFYSGLIYEAMGFGPEMFTVLFAVARTAGWVAHWLEFLDDPERKITRPRQLYTGAGRRDYPVGA